MSTTNASDPKTMELLETVRKKRAALEARLRKEPYRAIADRLGVSVGTVRIWVKEMTQTMLPQEEVDELRAQEANSYDESEGRILALMDMCAREAARREAEGKSVGYDLDRIGRFEELLVQVRKQRALLLGTNMPVKVNHAVTVRTEFDAEVEELTSLLLNGGDLLSGPEDVDTGAEVESV